MDLFFASNFLVIILLRGVVLSVCLVHLCVSRFVFFLKRGVHQAENKLNHSFKTIYYLQPFHLGRKNLVIIGSILPKHSPSRSSQKGNGSKHWLSEVHKSRIL